jgi:hypothetical protein
MLEHIFRNHEILGSIPALRNETKQDKKKERAHWILATVSLIQIQNSFETFDRAVGRKTKFSLPCIKIIINIMFTTLKYN